jgi:predicted GH43/DUF377 family glycosyl hydrolase
MRGGMKKQTRNFVIFFASMLLLSSCVSKPSIERRLSSGDKNTVRAALVDVWRMNGSEHMMAAVEYLSDPDLMEAAAFALAALGTDVVDKVVANHMNRETGDTGCLLYFMFRYRDTSYNGMLRELVKDAARPGRREAAGDFMYAAITGDYEKAEALFGQASGIKAAQKEFIIMLGGKKITQSYVFLEKLLEPDLKPFAAWAMRRIKPLNIVKYDLPDRTIAANPYWEKYGGAPVMPAAAGTFKSWHTANPDILVENGMVYFYYRGGDGTDRIAAASAPYESFDGTNLTDYPKNPVIGTGSGAFDGDGVLDPAAVYFNKQVFLYYSGMGIGDDSVGLAVSKDFYNFTKYKKNPVLTGRAPEVVLKDGLLYMYYVKQNERFGYSIYLATSRDGYNFTQYWNAPVFSYGDMIEWDSKSVTVPRIREKDGVYYMFYAGDDKFIDYPAYFGIAFSYDLVNWFRGTQNPVFSRGKKGDWDDGGIWFAEVLPYKKRLFMYYEGWGGAESHEKEYGPGGRSQIGLAISGYQLEDML